MHCGPVGNPDSDVGAYRRLFGERCARTYAAPRRTCIRRLWHNTGMALDKHQQTLAKALQVLADTRGWILRIDDGDLSGWEAAETSFWSALEHGKTDGEHSIPLVLFMLTLWRACRVPYARRKEEACAWLRAVAETLIIKNEAYGAAISDPCNYFCDMPAAIQCASRVDAKLSRLKYGSGSMDKEDTMLDLAGYLALLYGLSEVFGDGTEEITEAFFADVTPAKKEHLN